MAYNEPLGKQVERKKDAYYNNPQVLEKRVRQNNDLLGVLALQKLKTDKEAAQRQLALAQQQNPKELTIAQQLEREHLEGNKKNIAEAVSQVGGVMQQQQAQQQNNLRRAAQGAVPPPQAAAQGVAPPPNVANTGIAAAPRTPMRMAQGGVIGFERGRSGSGNFPTSNYPGGRVNPLGPSKYGLQDLLRDVRTDDETAAAMAAGLSLEEFHELPAETQAQYRRQVQQQGAAIRADVPGGVIPAKPQPVPQPVVKLAEHEDKVGKGQQLPSAVGEGPETQAEFMVPGAPDPGEQPAAQQPFVPPLVKKDPKAAVGKAEQVSPDLSGIQKLLQKSVTPEGTGIYGNPPEGAPFPIAPEQQEAMELARERAAISPVTRAEEMGKLAKTWLGRDDAKGKERERAAIEARLLSQHYNKDKLQRELLLRQLTETARTGRLAGGAAGAAALQQEQEAAQRAGVRGIFDAERADEALDTAVREKTFTAVREAYKSADTAIGQGLTAMSGIARDQQNRLTEKTKAEMASKDKKLDRILLATYKFADVKLRADIANIVSADLQKRRSLDLKLAGIRAGSVNLSSAEKELSDNIAAMNKHKLEIQKLYDEKLENLQTDPEYRAKGADKAAIRKKLRDERDQLLATTIAGWPDRIKELKAEIKKLRRGPLKSVTQSRPPA